MMWRELFLLVLLGLGLLPGTTSLDEAGIATMPEQPIAIVIMALARSGSTLVGQLFRQNKDVLYFYEPCRANGDGVLGRHEQLFDEECLALVRRLTRCELTVQDSDRLTVDEKAARNHSPAAANVHWAVKESRIRGTVRTEDALAEAHDNLMEKCKASRAVAAKTIRILGGVGDAASYETSGVHVLHLVRDPRAVVRSQLWMRGGLKGFKSVLPNGEELERIGDWRKRRTETRRAVGRHVCHNYRMQLESPGHLDGDQYLRVRYEDFAVLPQVVASLIYSWSGLGKVPAGLATWIDNNTRLENCEDPTRRQLALAASAIGHEGAAAADDGRGGALGGRGGEEGGGSAGSSRGKGNLRRHRNRVATAAVSALGTERVSRLPPRLNRASPTGVAAAAAVKIEGAAVKTEDAVTVEGAVKVEGATVGLADPEPRRLDPAARGGGGGRGAAVGQEANDGAFALEQSPPRRAAAAAAAAAPGGSNCDNTKHAAKDPYGTKRHSSQMANFWRTQMPEQDAVAIWEACIDSNVMQELQYSI